MWRVKDWDDNFENNRSRELAKLEWVPIPNKMNGDGYTELVSHPDGAAHFGAWIAIVEIASISSPRGILVRNNSKPHDCESLARLSRLGVAVFEAAIPRLVHIGWLEVIDQGLFEDELGMNRIAKDRGADRGSATAATQDTCNASLAIPQRDASRPQDGAGPRPMNGKGNRREIHPARSGGAAAEEVAMEFDLCRGPGSRERWVLTVPMLEAITCEFPSVDVPAECEAARVKLSLEQVEQGPKSQRMPGYLRGWMRNAPRLSAGPIRLVQTGESAVISRAEQKVRSIMEKAS